MLDWRKGGAKNSSSNRKFKLFFLFLFILIIIIGIIFLLFIFPKSNSNVTAIPTCGDGSFYNTCSLDKPYYCYKGILTENVLSCGCPDVLTKQGLTCVSLYQSGSESLNLSYVLDGINGGINFVAYSGLVTYLSTLPESIIYGDGQQPLRADFKLMRIDEPNQDALIMPLVKDIENLAPNDKTDQARIAISLVQNIPWGSSGETIPFGRNSVNYSRYPYTVLYDNQGLCGEKSELLVTLLKDLGYGVALFYYPQENHEAVGIKCPIQNSLNGTGYCFVETSGPAIISDSSIIYENGITLTSLPEIVLISNGISLPEGMYEYNDAKTLANLRNQGNLNFLSSYQFGQLETKYGLSKVYNIT
jgi:hypothetical protein